jgi:5-formyltetrahydrofolate cyclo-ligase
MQKAELRKIFLDARKGLTDSAKKQKSELVAARFAAAFDLSGVETLHCFLPIERFGEIDTGLIFERVWRDFPRIATFVPRVDRRTNELENLLYTPATELVRGSWEIREPAHDDTIAAEKIDLVLVPLLCFDRRGYRVGYGKGFYDRLLRNCREDCRRIGLSYFPPVAEISDVHAGDEKLDYCVTPEEILELTSTTD